MSQENVELVRAGVDAFNQLHFEAEVSEADGRADAHARVIEAVKQVDPEFAVIKGGDIFNRAL
jgi:hypothetical protein